MIPPSLQQLHTAIGRWTEAEEALQHARAALLTGAISRFTFADPPLALVRQFLAARERLQAAEAALAAAYAEAAAFAAEGSDTLEGG